ncbi:uncharacterized protein LOC123451145 [Hordeum vulgare subsp. vulgare]|uniref:Uncharacterized protein n=1 Tax=Hordeum vulgare subsp. vulgare TaxID=112509 RepID=A0A8I6X9B0_HORVV|nr:uncharacterized protein LOC123451145 [Hordeum vulgare subsp. vulgare]KAI4998316.1 hypothetical protein ZWY2020_053658 [Hordeum vulgare]KAI4998321.1 hypothetical protein ZWY2020_053663 [Hordeum vulgare]
MARCSRACLPLLLLLFACGLVQSSYGSRPSPRGAQEHGALSPAMVHGDGAIGFRPSTVKGAAGRRGANDDDGGGGGVESSEQREGSGSPVLRQALGRMLLGSKLARRVLGGEAEDSAAGPSCHSNNAHITCTPPAQH